MDCSWKQTVQNNIQEYSTSKFIMSWVIVDKIEIDWPTSAKGVNGPAHAQEEDWEDEGSRQNFERQLTTEKRAEGSNLWLKFIFFRFVFYFNLL
jgi:hypothetical protein